MSDVAVVDLFAGAGGLGLAARAQGARLALSMDNDSYSCETLRRNASSDEVVIQGDVVALAGADLRRAARLGASEELVVVGGPPCQPFSKAAYWLEDGDDAAYRRARARGERVVKPALPTKAREDSRRTLVQEYWRLVQDSGAAGFVFENVPSILHPRNRHVFDDIVSRAARAGYKTTTVVAKATDYGVAQARQRVFLLGSLDRSPESPSITHGERGTSPVVVAGEVLAPFASKEYFEPEEVVTGRWADHLNEVKPGMNYKWHTEWAGHPTPTFITETRYWNFLLKLAPELPSWTLPASPGPWTGPFHWDSRRLRTPEMAALQDFPESYDFAGPRRERVRQIGNAVPVAMGTAMIGAVMESVQARRAVA